MSSLRKYIHDSKGFTLIELLVVVSIISMLASIVITSVASARDKARIGAAIVFEDTNYHAFGSDALAHINFNSGSGIPDLSSDSSFVFNDNDCSVLNPTCNGSYSKDTPSNNGYSFNFVPGSSPMTLVSVKPVSLSKFVVSGWVKPTAQSSVYLTEGYCLSAQCPTVSAQRIFKIWLLYQPDGSFVIHTGSNVDYVDVPVDAKIGRWSLLTLSYDGTTFDGGTNTFTVWVDGKLVSKFNGGNALPQNGFVDTINIGVDTGVSPVTVDDVSVLKGHL